MTKTPLRLTVRLVLGASLFFAVSISALAAEASPAFAFYTKYLEEAAAAKNLEDLSVFMPGWWNDRQRSASAADQAASVERIRKVSADLTAVELEREEPIGGDVRLHMTARSGGLPMQGTVTLIRESGAFKVEESKWRSVEPTVN